VPPSRSSCSPSCSASRSRCVSTLCVCLALNGARNQIGDGKDQLSVMQWTSQTIKHNVMALICMKCVRASTRNLAWAEGISRFQLCISRFDCCRTLAARLLPLLIRTHKSLANVIDDVSGMSESGVGSREREQLKKRNLIWPQSSSSSSSSSSSCSRQKPVRVRERKMGIRIGE
jgi:hypothetical protein